MTAFAVFDRDIASELLFQTSPLPVRNTLRIRHSSFGWASCENSSLGQIYVTHLTFHLDCTLLSWLGPLRVLVYICILYTRVFGRDSGLRKGIVGIVEKFDVFFLTYCRRKWSGSLGVGVSCVSFLFDICRGTVEKVSRSDDYVPLLCNSITACL